MKRYKNFLIVGIDHGYGNIKTANTVTPTGITRLDAAPIFTRNTLCYNGNYYLIGEGHKEYLADKWEDNDNYLFTLMGIARELNRPVHWNPATLSFEGDKEAFAHRLYYYDYRRPYTLPYLERRG